MDEARRRIEEAAAARRAGDPDTAERLYQSGLELALERGDARLRILASKGIGQIARDRGDRETALRWTREAVQAARDHGDEALLAYGLRHLAGILIESGRFAEAEGPSHEARALLEANPRSSPLERSNCLRDCALVAEGSGRGEDARAAWREVRDRYASLGIEEGVAEAQQHLDALGGPPAEPPPSPA